MARRTIPPMIPRVKLYVVPFSVSTGAIPQISAIRSAKVQRMEKGISFLIELDCTHTGAIAALAPRTTSVLKMLEPTTLLIARAFSPARAELIETEASGRLVPIATMVSPMMIVGTLRVFAILDEPSTNQSAPFISITKPTMMPKKARKIYIFTFILRKARFYPL